MPTYQLPGFSTSLGNGSEEVLPREEAPVTAFRRFTDYESYFIDEVDDLQHWIDLNA